MASRDTLPAHDRLRPLPLIRTKLFPPALPNDHVARNRLLSTLDQALEVPLTIVSAPAGYGKTILASAWVQRHAPLTAWLSLDTSDGELRQFLDYLCAAVCNAAPEAMSATRDLLDGGESAPADVVAANVLHDFDDLDAPVVVVLDDFHRLRADSPAVDLLAAVLDHPAAGIHFVILSRRDPPLPLGRLRARCQLAEIRLRNLRFEPNEARRFLESSLPRPLSDGAIRHLEKELEGWAVGLRLVSLMLRRSTDPESVIAGLRGGLPESQDYMLQEVLAQMPAETRRCLLRSSILSRFTADTIAAVCPRLTQGGGEFVRELRRSNLFATTLDPERRWFRYHHWFQHVLARELAKESAPEDIRALHITAAEWFDANDEHGEALTHFLEADAPERAIALIGRHYLARIEQDQWYVVDRWLRALPAAVRDGSAIAQLANAWVAYCKLDFAAVSACLDRIAVLAGDGQRHAGWEFELAFLQGWLVYWTGDLAQACQLLDRAKPFFSLNPGMIAGEVRLYRAFAMCMGGDYPGAVRFLTDELAAAGASAGTLFLQRLHGAHAHVALLSGDIAGSDIAIARTRAVSSSDTSRYVAAWTDYFSALQHFGRLELPATVDFLDRCEAHLNVLEHRVAADVLAVGAMARLLAGDVAGAAEARERLDAYVRNFRLPEFVWIVESVSARCGLLSGEAGSWLGWARQVALPETVPLEAHFWVTNPGVTQARVLVSAGETVDIEHGLSLLEALSSSYRKFHNLSQLLDVDVLRALGLFRLGRPGDAEDMLMAVVTAAAPGEWLRPFVEGGELVREMLTAIDTREMSSRNHIARVLDAFAQPYLADMAQTLPTESAADGAVALSESDSVDTLTNRELDILEFLDQRLQNKEIAARLFISPHTVGYHLKHIYQKLGVHSRRQAVVNARKAGIIPSR